MKHKIRLLKTPLLSRPPCPSGSPRKFQLRFYKPVRGGQFNHTKINLPSTERHQAASSAEKKWLIRVQLHSPGKNTGVGCHFLLQCRKVKSESEFAQSCPTFSTPWTAAYQAPLSMGVSRQEYWSGVPLPSPASGIPGHFFFLQCLLKVNIWFGMSDLGL